MLRPIARSPYAPTIPAPEPPIRPACPVKDPPVGRHTLNSTHARKQSSNTRPVAIQVPVVRRRTPAHAAPRTGSALPCLAVKSVAVGLMAVSVTDLTGPIALAATGPSSSDALVRPAERRTEARDELARPLTAIAPRLVKPREVADRDEVARKPAKKAVKKKAKKEHSHARHRAEVHAPGHVLRWIDSAISIMRDRGIAVSHHDAAKIWTIVLKESSGNPRAINLWDSNARAGHPSKGLMQTIDTTFAAYKLPGYNDIYNPVHNIIAGVRYTLSRYGGLNGHPGLQALSGGGAYVGY